jgi:Zn-dependent metalloprotease
MKRLLPLAFALAAVVCFFPSLDAQNQNRIFTTGTPAELAQARALGLQRLRARAAEKGFGMADDLVVSSAHVDRLSMAHTRVQQRFGGIPVLGGEAIAHLNADGSEFAETDNLIANINVSTTPLVTQAAAIDAAVGDYGCRTCLTATPTADLWIVRDDAGVDHLTYRVQLTRLDGTSDTALPVRFIDAQGGQVVLAFDNLQTGTGTGVYNGTVSIGTSFNAGAGQYFMENLTRRVGTFDIMNVTSGSIFRIADADDVWNGPRHPAAVDAHYGAEKYLDYLQSVHGRNGIDGVGGPFFAGAHDGSGGLISMIVHFGSNYNNAFWDGTNKVMVYGDGDGSQFGPLVTLDIAGHEMTHGVTQFTAGLIYQGESGALNESWSDVFGALLERQVRGESANTWKLAEEAYTPGTPGDALRHMDNPHLASNKGFTADDDPDHYSERYTGASDNGGVHINSGISNNAFYLLAHGGSHHLGGSMTGIGADAAAHIWYTALASYMTSGTNFAGARTATTNAATAIYGSPSAQKLAVEQAWCLVGVGACPVVVTVQAVSVTPNSGTGVTQTFTLAYTDSAGAAADMNGAFVRFTNNATGALCQIQHRATTGLVRLMGDDGITWGTFTAYGSGTLTNSQCTLNLGSSSATPSGNDLSVALNITFKGLFGGPTTVAMKAQSLTGATTGWLNKGTWTVGGATVGAVSITPDSGIGMAQTFTALFTDSLGASADLKRAMVRFGASTVNACVVDYNAITATVRLFDDTGVPGAPASFGSGTLSNSQCTLNLTQSSAAPSGTSLTLTLRLSFKAPLLGAQPIFMRAMSNFTTNTGWLAKGTFTVGADVQAILVVPNSGSQATETFGLLFSDSEGVTADLVAARVRFRDPVSGVQCGIAYNAMTNKVRMLDDAGIFGPFVDFGSGTLTNSQCTLDLAASGASPDGNELTLLLVITFKPAFAGAKNIDMRANSNLGSTTGWVNRGTWTVP